MYKIRYETPSRESWRERRRKKKMIIIMDIT
jgi:hypothetical protein